MKPIREFELLTNGILQPSFNKLIEIRRELRNIVPAFKSIALHVARRHSDELKVLFWNTARKSHESSSEWILKFRCEALIEDIAKELSELLLESISELILLIHETSQEFPQQLDLRVGLLFEDLTAELSEATLQEGTLNDFTPVEELLQLLLAEDRKLVHELADVVLCDEEVFQGCCLQTAHLSNSANCIIKTNIFWS